MVDPEQFNVIMKEEPLLPRRTGSINVYDADVDSDQDNDEPLLDAGIVRPTASHRHGGLELSAQEAERLLGYLEDASNILRDHLDLTYTERRITGKRLSAPVRCEKLRKYCGRIIKKFTGAKVMAATILFQLICLVMLTLVDTLPRKESSKETALQAGSIGMIILQTANLVVIIIISGQLAAQVHSRRVSGTLLIQSYLATILLFAGIYTATYRLAISSWKFVEDPVDNKDPDMVVTTYTRFLFYSVSTATLCGAADALPKAWYTCIFSSCQMLLSFMYFTSVIGTALTQGNKQQIRLPPFPEEMESLRRSKHREMINGGVRT